MILQLQGTCIGVGLVFRNRAAPFPSRSTAQVHMIMNQDTIMENGKGCPLHDLTVITKYRPMKNNVVALPFPGFTTGIHIRFLTPIQCTRLAIRIGAVPIAVQDLHFVLPHEGRHRCCRVPGRSFPSSSV